MIQKLGVFLSPSAVRNILRRARPRPPRPVTDQNSTAPGEPSLPRTYPGIFARYPNHLWSADLTVVNRWMLWPTYILVVIDHFSRKAICVKPLMGPNAGWMIDALQNAFRGFGAPRHIVTDHGTVFTSGAFKDFLEAWAVKHRLGAIGKTGSIAVTERLIKTLKYEWFRRTPILKEFDWLLEQCHTFREWYNQWRPHSFLIGATPDEMFSGQQWKPPPHNAKTIPLNIEVKVFPETRVVAYRLKKAA